MIQVLSTLYVFVYYKKNTIHQLLIVQDIRIFLHPWAYL